MTLYYKTAHELNQLIRTRAVSVEELVQAHLNRITEVDGRVRAFLTLHQDAVKEARELDAALQRGDAVSPLTGIPVAYKDNLCTSELPTTCASKMLANYHPPYDATVVKRLRSAGTVMLGKTNLDEFAMGSSTEHSAFFATRNPWDLERVPGGSSGGSAAAVAAGEVVVALGSDTGGSIRQPAAFCGIVGLKPTYGLVSRYGLVAFASSLDQIGPLTRDVRDCALLMDLLAGPDPLDATSLTSRAPAEGYSWNLQAGVKGLRIGVPVEYLGAEVSPEILDWVKRSITLLLKLGAEVEEVSLPHTKYALAAYQIIAPAEASSNLARFDGVRYGFRAPEAETVTDMYCQSRSEGLGSEVKRRIMLGTYALSAGYYDAYYQKAQKVRTLIRNDFARVFANYDVLLAPATPATAFRLGEKTENPLAMYQSDICTVSVNLAGIPALALPVGFSGEGLPVSVQLMGNHFAEATLLRTAYALEKELDLPERRPFQKEEV